MSDEELEQLEREIRRKLTMPKYKAGRALGWGRRVTDAAIEAGKMPIIDGPKQTVPTAWLLKQLHLVEDET
jgi:hypothetical protein